MRKRSEAAAAKLPADAVEASRELKEELKRAPANQDPPLFMTAHGGDVSAGLTALVETLYVPLDPSVAKRLERELAIAEGEGTNYKVINDQLGKAEDNARAAFDLYLNVKAEVAMWEASSEITMSALRNEAREALEIEKAQHEAGSKTKGKQITEADVTAKIAELHPDEWNDQNEKRAKYTGVVKKYERLAELWKQRCYSLSTMLTQLRK